MRRKGEKENWSSEIQDDDTKRACSCPAVSRNGVNLFFAKGSSPLPPACLFLRKVRRRALFAARKDRAANTLEEGAAVEKRMVQSYSPI
ncbi:hypothetical protein KPH14_012422 [Odynerus spinipes]|uniref:Uncharacterized protein n=1 Tax=Odynerus spinipes TaxID=1348599 RepID=A0AAD9RI69_9HYME|nr:hypothetical protein KPH14_012422 [Odynerus spinipes]